MWWFVQLHYTPFLQIFILALLRLASWIQNFGNTWSCIKVLICRLISPDSTVYEKTTAFLVSGGKEVSTSLTKHLTMMRLEPPCEFKKYRLWFKQSTEYSSSLATGSGSTSLVFLSYSTKRDKVLVLLVVFCILYFALAACGISFLYEVLLRFFHPFLYVLQKMKSLGVEAHKSQINSRFTNNSPNADAERSTPTHHMQHRGIGT